MRKKLPIGIQTFKELITESYVYIDKTKYIYNLVNELKYVFLGRPRRFGKSLLLSTMHSLFEGDKELFYGLYVYDKWDWDIKYPVINISMMGTKNGLVEDFELNLRTLLIDNAKRLGVEYSENTTIPSLFGEIIRNAQKKYNQRTVVLVDEYDKPVIDNIHDPELANKFKNILADFYSELKSNDAYIKFAFLTGVSKFTKMSVFSGANNVTSISLAKRYANICGYTQYDLENSFKEYLDGIDLDALKEQYNGYNFRGKEGVYNPFDILLYLNAPENGLKNYWYESGNPSFFIELLKKHNYDLTEIRGIEVSESELESKNIENEIPFFVLLYQTGYLTIKKEFQKINKTKFILDFPNLEVKESFSNLILNYLNNNSSELSLKQQAIEDLFVSNNFENFEDIIKSLFANIPYNYTANTPLAKYEAYYATVILTYFYSIGINTTPEAQTNIGRIDLSFEYDGTVYILEYKVLESAKKEPDKIHTAIKQIKDNQYFEKYKARAKTIYLIGMEFGKEEKNLINLDLEVIKI